MSIAAYVRVSGVHVDINIDAMSDLPSLRRWPMKKNRRVRRVHQQLLG